MSRWLSVFVAWALGICLFTATLGCAHRERVGPVAGAPESLKVALYPYVPRLSQFRDVIAAEWKNVQPDVTLEWVADWDGGYSVDPDPSYDVFVFDAMNLGYLQSKGFLHPMSKTQVRSYGDLLPFAAAGVTFGDQILAIPQIGCGDFLFYRATDLAIAKAATASQLAQALGMCTYYSEKPPDPRTGLMVDLAGGTTSAGTYVQSVHEHTNSFPVPLPETPAQIDPAVASTIQGIVGLSSFPNVLFSSDTAPYQRAEWFAQGYGRAYVGFTESMSQLDPGLLPSIAFKPMPWSDNPQGAFSPLFYSDVVGVGAATGGRGTTDLAIQLANLMTSPSVIVKIFGGTETSGPQYLMPVSTSALAQLASQYPAYAKLQEVLSGLNPIFFDLGAGSKEWLRAMKSSMHSMTLASPKCYCDIAAPAIADNADAKTKCPQVCAEHGGWNGQWANQPSPVCGCACGARQ